MDPMAFSLKPQAVATNTIIISETILLKIFSTMEFVPTISTIWM
jgi:hypothetical protein